MKTLEELLAREAIRDTLATYNIMGDRGLIEAYAATFTEDGVLEMPPATVTGRAGIVRFVKEVGIPALNARLTGKPAPLRHNITTSRIELAGTDSARVTTYFLLLRAGRIEESGIYLDRFARVADAWLIAHRRIKMEFVIDTPPQ
jgi:hypothetical protein